ncbi:6-bladed beta-propeller [Planctomycetota bacterium]
MSAKGLSTALVVLCLFVHLISASQEYQVVQVWPEIPQGWHFYQPMAVGVDSSGNVYVGDSGNYCVKKFDSDGRYISQWGSPGQEDGHFNMIRVVKVGHSGTVYVLDQDRRPETDYRRRIQMFTSYGRFIRPLDRKAPEASKAKTTIDVAEDVKGNIVVLAINYDNKVKRIRRAVIEKYSPAGEFIREWRMDDGSEPGQLHIPTALTVDVQGNIYIAEIGNDRIQKFDPEGKFLTQWATRGDGQSNPVGPCSIAINNAGELYVLSRWTVTTFSSVGELLAMWQVRGATDQIAVDSQSNFYVTSRQLHRIMKCDSTGKLISEWGSSAGATEGRFGSEGPGSIAVAPSGHIVVGDVDNKRVQIFTSEGQFDCEWGGECLFDIDDLAADASGNLYVACEGSNEIQKYNRDGKLICRWQGTGNGDGQFKDPADLAVDTLGNVFIADSQANRVLKFTSEGKFLVKWGALGDGDGQFKNLSFIAADRSGHVWVADRDRMQKFDSNGKFLTGWTKKVYAKVAMDLAGNSYYALEDRIEKYDANGGLIGSYAQEAFAKEKLGTIKGLCVDQAGNLYIVDNVGTLLRLDAAGNLTNKWTVVGTENMTRNDRPITVDGTGSVYTSTYAGQMIYKYSSEGTSLAEFRIEPPEYRNGFTELGGVTVDGSGRIYAVDSVDLNWEWGLPAIQKLDTNGQYIATWDLLKAAAGKIRYPVSVAVDSIGSTYVTDKGNHCVHKLDAQGKYVKSWGSKGAANGQFDTPEGIATDTSGNVYVCDRKNSCIQKFDSNGTFLTKLGKQGSGDGEFQFPAAVAVDKKGYVYVADSNNNRIQKFTPQGEFLTKWGEFGEEPGQFRVPLGIALDSSGNVYVSDSHNHRIQKFAPAYSP